MALLDAAQDRVATDSINESVRIADSVRAAGAEQRDYTRWRASVLRGSRHTASVGLDGANLEAVIMGLARTHPEYVIMER